MCKKDEACSAFRSRWPDDGTEVKEGDMQCYKGGLAVQENFQMCDVTSEYRNRDCAMSTGGC